jgi:hypothetical protein
MCEITEIFVYMVCFSVFATSTWGGGGARLLIVSKFPKRSGGIPRELGQSFIYKHNLNETGRLPVSGVLCEGNEREQASCTTFLSICPRHASNKALGMLSNKVM